MRAPTDRARLERVLQDLGRSVHHPVRFYLVGGAVMVVLGLREATVDIDFVAAADKPQGLAELERRLPRAKDELDVNLEPASPADFMPVPNGALSRSPYVRSYGPLAVYHYDYPSLVLAKIARSTERDLTDVELLLRAGIVAWVSVEAGWNEVRDREAGWLRQTPREVETRLERVRQRLRDAGLIPAES
jgi:hypothetical protein